MPLEQGFTYTDKAWWFYLQRNPATTNEYKLHLNIITKENKESWKLADLSYFMKLWLRERIFDIYVVSSIKWKSLQISWSEEKN